MKPDTIKKIVVIGSGIMGPGIAQTFAQHGYSVYLSDRDKQKLKTGKNIIKDNLNTLSKYNKVKAADIDSIVDRITLTSYYESAAQYADLIVECITEDAELKKALYDHLHEICPQETILLSNTSYLNIFNLIHESRQETTVIAHWFAPPQIVPLVEVVKGPITSVTTIETVLTLLNGIGKTPALMEKYIPGFAMNRIQRIIGREIFFLLDNGYITAEQLDLAVKASLAPRMMVLGLVQRYDFTGLELSARNIENPDYIEPPIDNRPKSLFDLVEKGLLGVKTGKGFYDYENRPLEELLRERDEKLLTVMNCVNSLIG